MEYTTAFLLKILWVISVKYGPEQMFFGNPHHYLAKCSPNGITVILDDTSTMAPELVIGLAIKSCYRRMGGETQ